MSTTSTPTQRNVEQAARQAIKHSQSPRERIGILLDAVRNQPFSALEIARALELEHAEAIVILNQMVAAKNISCTGYHSTKRYLVRD